MTAAASSSLCAGYASAQRRRPGGRHASGPAAATRRSRSRPSRRAWTTRCRPRPRSRPSSTASATTSSARRPTGSSTPPPASPSRTSRRRSRRPASTTATGEFNDWTYSMGVVLAGDAAGHRGHRRHAASRTTRSRTSTSSSTTSTYFRRQAKEFGPQPRGYRRLLDMRELDDCGAIGAALIKAYREEARPALPGGHRPGGDPHLDAAAAAAPTARSRARARSRWRSGSTTPT